MPDYPSFVPRQRFQKAVALSPDGRTVAYSSDSSGQFNLWLQPVAGGPPRQVTYFTGNAVRQMAWAPDGKSLVFAADQDGDEQFQIYRAGTSGGTQPVRLTTASDRQHRLPGSPFSPDGRHIIYGANDRDPGVQDVILHDLDTSEERRFIPPAGLNFWPDGISPDGRWLLTTGFASNTDLHCYLADLTNPSSEPVLVTGDSGPGYFDPVTWGADSRGFYLRTNTWGEYASAAYYSLDEAVIKPVATADWDVESIAAAGGTVLWDVNEAGRSVLHARRADSETMFSQLPDGVITALDLAADGSLAAVRIDTPTRPAEIAVLDTGSGEFRYLTDTRPPGLLAVTPAGPDIVSYSARDGRTVQGLLYRPRGDGPFPVLYSLHGGPECQERPDYELSGMYQYLLSRGIAVFAPNVAGSSGYGITFQTMIYRDWGGIDLRDLEDGLAYLRSLAWTDEDRIAVSGASYGGFCALSCLSRIPFPWAAGVSMYGPANLVTLAAAAPPTWKHFVAMALGDPDTDAELLRERSPLTHADGINAPLLVIQGTHDPRVPQAEADQIVSKLNERGVEVQYELYEGEGHGFTNRENEISACTQIADFLTSHLLPR